MRKVCIQVAQHLGEQLRILLAEKRLLDTRFPITKEQKQLLFPLVTSINKQQRLELEEKIPGILLVEKELEPLNRKPADLATALEGKIPAAFLETIPHSLDIIGNIAVVELAQTLSSYEHTIGKAIMEVNPQIISVYLKEGGIKGVCRIRPVRLIAGKAQTTTIHTEYGVRLAVDITQTYFSPRLGTEHDRVTKQIQPNEVIVDMFTGVGPFALLAAKRQPVKVFAIDINKRAIDCLQKSLTLNRLRGEVIPLAGDARILIQEQLVGKADRIIMNLPHDAFAYLDIAVRALKSTGGIVHFYGITTESRSLETLSHEIKQKLKKFGLKVIIENTRIVRPSAPHEFQVVLDLHIVPN